MTDQQDAELVDLALLEQNLPEHVAMQGDLLGTLHHRLDEWHLIWKVLFLTRAQSYK